MSYECVSTYEKIGRDEGRTDEKGGKKGTIKKEPHTYCVYIYVLLSFL